MAKVNYKGEVYSPEELAHHLFSQAIKRDELRKAAVSRGKAKFKEARRQQQSN